MFKCDARVKLKALVGGRPITGELTATDLETFKINN
jgi:hypothetical protein